jgi:hypothetical protein
MVEFTMVLPVNVVAGSSIRRLSSLKTNFFQKAIAFETFIIPQMPEKMDWHVNAEPAELTLYLYFLA